MKLTRTEWKIWVVLCNLLVVLAGVFAIYYIECRINMGSRDLARTAAEEMAEYLAGSIQKTEEDAAVDRGAGRSAEKRGSAIAKGLDAEAENPVAADAGTYLTYSVFFQDEEGVRPLHVYYGQKDLPFVEKIKDYNRFYEEGKSFYTVGGVFQRPDLISVAGHPVWHEDQYLGYIYVVRILDYALRICLAYAVVSTVLFLLITYVIYSQRKSREMIEQIYHQYIANISHELKSPIASISAITETLSEGLVTDEMTVSRYYGIILREAKLLEHSVLQIIDLSKLQDQRNTFEKTYVSPHELFDPIWERFSSRCDDIGINFSIRENIWELPQLFTDGFRMTQLLEILLDNACKFVEEDGHIFIDATTKYGQATIRVNDDGRGISKEDLPHIFERFYKTNVNNPTGTGLGLAIAKEITRGLGEEIWVSSEEGKGTIFFVTVAMK